MKKLQKAFSLIELSIVILIIGILVAGITQSSRLVRQFKLTSARTITQSSPVSGIKNLALWYETSREESILASEAVDAGGISTWYDNNVQSTYKNNATQSTTDSKPKYYENVFNSAIPAIRFDGVDDYLGFDGTIFVGTDYTVFVVEQRRLGGASAIRPFIGGSASVAYQNLHIGYRDDQYVTHSHYGTLTANYAFAAYSTPIPRFHTFTYNSVSGTSYWTNGGGTAATDTNVGNLTAFASATIGRYDPTSKFYGGDIAEIIVFSRTLKTEERQSVESYLSKKYAIKIS